ncbi:Encoded by [Rhizoctonia solani]|uniref:DNA 3'-5' helicase n=1 Tax=Rhizoctonia solani TaxID=456999 RepID=A0A8H7M0D2_9AGAM|nr:Encoded by [Rhizoctonia solani]
MSRNSSTLCVLPTGAGKSIMFGAPPLLETGITIVCFSLRALRDDQIVASEKRQKALYNSGAARGRDITIRKWDLAALEDGVYAVMVETLDSTSFRQWLDTKLLSQRINRFVIDKVHLVITMAHFCDIMQRLTFLTATKVPIVGLTATLPPHYEEPLRDALGRPTWRIFQESTDCPNLEYHIARYANATHAELALAAHISRYEKQLGPGEGIMIICRYKNTVKRLAVKHGWLTYHRHALGSLDGAGISHNQIAAEDKESEKNLMLWTGGACRTIIGTTALGTGVHHPACRVVCHLGPPWGVPEWDQGNGRGGREWAPALCFTFDYLPRDNMPPSPFSTFQVLENMLDTHQCPRLIRSTFIDGLALARGCMGTPNARLCGRCIASLRRAEDADGVWGAGSDPLYNQPIPMSTPSDIIVENLPTFHHSSGPLTTTPNLLTIDDDEDVMMVPVVPPSLSLGAPVGPLVISDAISARTQKEQEQMDQSDPLQAGTRAEPYCIEALIMAKEWLVNCCVWRNQVYRKIMDFIISAGGLNPPSMAMVISAHATMRFATLHGLP